MSNSNHNFPYDNLPSKKEIQKIPEKKPRSSAGITILRKSLFFLVIVVLIIGGFTATQLALWSVGAGGALTRLGAFLYALQGGKTTGFAKLELSTNTWTTLANVPGAVSQGGGCPPA